MRRSLCLFVPNPYNMGFYQLPWTPATKICHFELTQDHLNTEDAKGTKITLSFLFLTPIIWLSTDSTGP